MQRFCLIVGTSAVLAGLACSDGTPATNPRAEPVVLALPALLVSDAQPAVPAEGGASGRDAGSGASGMVAFLSLPPGTLPQMETVRIRNLTSGTTSAAIPMIDGGFDPVPVAATEGDQLELSFTDRSGTVSLAYIGVPPRRPPRVVRTKPPRGRTDVALSVAPVVVFSEPVDPRTLAMGVRLLRDGIEVAASVAPVSGKPWTAELVPDSFLEPETTYQLQVTAAVTDVDGDVLEEEVTVEFRTDSQTLTPPPPTVVVSNVTTGGGFDIDGYGVSVAVTGQPLQSAGLGLNRAVYFEAPAGEATVSLSDVAANCEVQDGPTRTVTVPEERYVEVKFEVLCTPLPELASIRLVVRRASEPCEGSRCWGAGAVWVMNADGTDARQITAGTGYEVGGAVSPDGTRIAFARLDPGSRSFWIYTVEIDNGAITQLTRGPGQSYDGWSRSGPAWSPDGSRLAFTHFDGQSAETRRIDVVEADGTNRRTLIDSAWGPAWSPDGSRIAFFRSPSSPYEDAELWIMDADGGNPGLVTAIREDWWPSPPTWTPDGSAIRFHTGNGTLWTVRPDGSDLVSRTPFPPNRCGAAWSADGTTYAFVNGFYCDPWLGFEGDIYLAKEDGTVWARITAEGRVASVGLLP